MSFSALSKIILARKLTFFTVSVFITASAVAFTLLVTPVFQSEALLMTTLDRAQRQQAQFPDTLRYQLNSQIYIINSEDVLRQAITEFGSQRLFPKQPHPWHALSALRSVSPSGLSEPISKVSEVISKVANLLKPQNPEEDRSDVDRALLQVKKRLAVNVEKDSQILSLTFRHEDPKIAEQFLGVVVRDFLQRQADLSGNAEAPAFFRQEASRYREEYKEASTALSEFARKNATYSVSQEIELALTRRDDTVAALAKTRGSIAEKEAQAATFQNTLAQLRRRISLPGEITGPKQNAPAANGSPSNDALTDSNKVPANESPLLLVRVFQDTAQSLVNLNSEIVGLRSLETSQSKTLADVERKLSDLSSVGAEFGRLKTDLDQVSKVLETHVARAAEAQMNADWDASEKLSSVKVAQSATAPTEPVFPPKPLFLTLGAVIGLLCGAAVCAMLEAVSARRQAMTMSGYWQEPSDERYRDEPFPERREPEDGNWQDPPDDRFRDRRAPEPDSWVPVHEVADYRFRR
jgi:polysaccharide biosynthesis transport protein